MNFDFDLVASEPSDANTNSTTLFSDDADDKSKKNANPELCMSTHHEEEVNVVERQIMVTEILLKNLYLVHEWFYERLSLLIFETWMLTLYISPIPSLNVLLKEK